MKPILLNIQDKTSLNDGNYCPPHYLPHSLPVIGEVVTDEPCHIHEARWRMVHHRVFCIVLRCPNYKNMMRAYHESQENR